MPISNAIYVDQFHGSDENGLRERVDKPFQTLVAAQTVAQKGDYIVVRSGAYLAENLDKEHIIWCLEPDTTVINDKNYMYCSQTVHILGHGELVSRETGVTFNFTGGNHRVQCLNISSETDVIHQVGGIVTMNINDYIHSTGNKSNVINISGGHLYLQVANHISAGGDDTICVRNTGGILYLECPEMISKYGGIISQSNTTLQIKQLTATNGPGLIVNGDLCTGQINRIYTNTAKLGSLMVMDGHCNMRFQEIENAAITGATIKISGGESNIIFNRLIASGGDACEGINITGGKVVIKGNVIKSKASAVNVKQGPVDCVLDIHHCVNDSPDTCLSFDATGRVVYQGQLCQTKSAGSNGVYLGPNGSCTINIQTIRSQAIGLVANNPFWSATIGTIVAVVGGVECQSGSGQLQVGKIESRIGVHTRQEATCVVQSLLINTDECCLISDGNSTITGHILDSRSDNYIMQQTSDRSSSISIDHVHTSGNSPAFSCGGKGALSIGIGESITNAELFHVYDDCGLMCNVRHAITTGGNLIRSSSTGFHDVSIDRAVCPGIVITAQAGYHRYRGNYQSNENDCIRLDDVNGNLNFRLDNAVLICPANKYSCSSTTPIKIANYGILTVSAPLDEKVQLYFPQHLQMYESL